LEIRITAVQSKARTGGDVVVFVPAEKVLIAGALYQLSYYPDIDAELDGDAQGWIDGMKQIIASVPLMKLVAPAKTAAAEAKLQAKPAPKPEPEKTLEEAVLVVSAYGVSNLQGMKDILEFAQKLRDDLVRRVKSRRGCDDFLVSISADPYRKFGNLEGYLPQLCTAVQKNSDER
jgi:glyoxylase-like metal-dependent hydrolase (beta-lactamase superfamily II)